MALRAFELPRDLPTLCELIPPTFQYPENPEWSIQQDEADSFVDSIRGIQRMWPVIRVMQWVTPSLRDVMRGYVWEEDGRPVGLVNVLRQGATDRWLIGNVSVLPEYRRRGIARKLVEASVTYARSRGAKSIVLDVIAGNVPAYTLYEALGFECYSGQTELIFGGDVPPEMVALPDGYRVEPLPVFAWQPRYALALRITPPEVRMYVPVEPGRYRQPPAMRVLFPLVTRAMGTRPQPFLVRQNAGDQPVASAGIQARTRAGGMNGMQIMLDPAHAVLAPYLVRFLLGELGRVSPGRRVELAVQQWQTPVREAAEAAGFVKKYDYHSMGMIVPTDAK